MASAGVIVGGTLGHYQLLEEIGAGGMGVVYRALDKRLEREVALKVLRPGALSDEKARKRFRKEAIVLSQLNHPNIATIHDFDTQDGVDFIVMEFISGSTLSARLGGKPMVEKDVIAFGAQLAEGLSAAHQHGIVHRDLKPGNLRLSSDGRLKILDFGLAELHGPAAALAKTESLSETLHIAGTLPYMAPEQVLGQEADERTDLHAAGLVLYEMATGGRPFKEVSQSQMLGAILRQAPSPPTKSNPQLSAELDRIICKCLEKERQDRYQSARELGVDLRRLQKGSTAPSMKALDRKSVRKWLATHWKASGSAALLLVIVAAGAIFYTRPRTAGALTEKDEILLADFVNSADEPIFDTTLKTALAVKLGESPFLNTVSETRVQRTLRLMEKPASEKLLGSVAREACQRLNVKALLNSSIAPLGSDYVITLEALNCQTGEALGREQVQARGKDQVLSVLGQAASRMRKQLGESINSVQRFDKPLEQATTSSIEALQAFSLGAQHLQQGGANLEAIRFFEHAVELDPNFALAYSGLGMCYFNMGESERALAYRAKAFGLRERVSERERYRITSGYEMGDFTSGELDKAITTLELYKRNYPRDPMPYNSLGIIYQYSLGWPDKALAENRRTVELVPDSATMHHNLAWNLIALNDYDGAAAVLDQATKKNLSSGPLSLTRYALAFIREDYDAMAHSVQETRGTAAEPRMVLQEAQTKAFAGRLREARTLYRQAVRLARGRGFEQFAESMLEHQALVEAEFGNMAEARAVVRQTRDRSGLAAIAFASVGETAKAQAIADERAKRFTAATLVQKIEVPLIHASIALKRGRPSEALETIQPVVPHELATIWCVWWFGCNSDVLYPVSRMYLAREDATHATESFQKILDHRGLYPTSPFYPLAYVGLARARTLAGDTAGARAAYERFFATWKDADPDIPILCQAKAEYAKLLNGIEAGK